MKKLLSSLCMLLFVSTALPQQCANTVNRYNGPTDSLSLATVLNDTSNAIINGLDSGTKNSIKAFMIFVSGMPVGFSGTDSSLTYLNSNSTYAASVYGAILGVRVLICTSNTLPNVNSISIDEFNDLPGKSLFYSEFSICTNCYAPGGGEGTYGVCCQIGGCGCMDDYVVVDEVKYRVQ